MESEYIIQNNKDWDFLFIKRKVKKLILSEYIIQNNKDWDINKAGNQEVRIIGIHHPE